MSSRSRILERATPVLAVLALALAGCGNGDDAEQMPGMQSGSTMPGMTSMPGHTSVTSADYNDADLMFLQMMYPHHAQALQMADLVPTRSQNPEVLDLATGIRNAQQPEMTRISELLQRFGQPAPSTAQPQDMPGMTSPGQMPGMASPGPMSGLESLSGAEFDAKWLTMMIDHHNSAIEMAKTEQESGKNPEVRQFADTIASAQQAEVDRMKGILGQN